MTTTKAMAHMSSHGNSDEALRVWRRFFGPPTWLILILSENDIATTIRILIIGASEGGSYSKKSPLWGSICNWSLIGRRPTLPHTCACSTIGAERLNYRVREGNGWDPLAKATRKGWCFQRPAMS